MIIMQPSDCKAVALGVGEKHWLQLLKLKFMLVHTHKVTDLTSLQSECDFDIK